jgi:hypothetical protein
MIDRQSTPLTVTTQRLWRPGRKRGSSLLGPDGAGGQAGDDLALSQKEDLFGPPFLLAPALSTFA